MTDEANRGTVVALPSTNLENDDPHNLIDISCQSSLIEELRQRVQKLESQQDVTQRAIKQQQQIIHQMMRVLFRQPIEESGNQIDEVLSILLEQLPSTEALGESFEERLIRVEEQNADSRAKSTANDVQPSLFHEDLKPNQKSVLQSILDLAEDAFADAERIFTALEGQPMTESFARSLAAVLTAKRWAVACGKCGQPAAVYWNADSRYSKGGHAQFSHSGRNGSVKHSSISCIGKLEFQKKIDRRRKGQ